MTPTPTHTAALRAVVAHWNEFGPECGFGELIDRAERALASLPAVQGEQRSAIELCATLCDDLRAKAMSDGQDAAAGWLHQAASHMRGLDARPSSVAPGGQPLAEVDEKDALDALDALFGENAIPMSDRNGLLYDIVQTAIQQGNSVVPTTEPPGATLSPGAASQWISVDERLPELHTEVLIAFAESSLPATGQLDRKRRHPGEYEWLYPAENGNWHSDSDWTVTHWMELPEHPTWEPGASAKRSSEGEQP